MEFLAEVKQSYESLVASLLNRMLYKYSNLIEIIPHVIEIIGKKVTLPIPVKEWMNPQFRIQVGLAIRGFDN